MLKAYGQGQRIVVVIDEAQNLTSEVLEQVRLLTNLEVSTQKLLQIILIGQPELQTMLDMPELRQLSQRITARFHLTPLTREETGEYITHRLKIAGVTREVFTKQAVSEIYKISRGIPRLINTLSERALIGAYGANLPMIKKDIVTNAAVEVLGKSSRYKQKYFIGWPAIGGIAVAMIVVALGLWGVVLSDKPRVSNAQANAVVEPIKEKVTVVSEIKRKPAMQRQSAPVIQQQAKLVQSTFAQQLISQSGKADTFSAFANLFSLWQRDYSAYSGDTACTRAIKAGMRCIFGRGEIDEILQYNRPAVLELKNANQEVVFALLHKADSGKLYLKIFGKDIQASTQELQQAWSGSYIVLWKPPFPDNESLAEGYVGPDVLWLRHQLDQIEGKKKAEYSADNLKFNSALAERVTQFQIKRGLKADGIVGRETFIELVNVSDSGAVPKLMPTNKG